MAEAINMGCPSNAILGKNLTFTVTGVASDGTPVDTDAVPTYSIYEDETGTAILTGSYAKLDDAGTTGLYSEQVAVSSANGFELFKTYTIYAVSAIGTVAVANTQSFLVVGAAVTVTATSGALTSVANFKTYAGISGSDDDALIQALINRATSAIQKYCDRTLLSANFRQRFDGTGDNELYLKEYPVTTIALLSTSVSDALRIKNVNSDAWNAYVKVTYSGADSVSLVCTIQGGTNDGSDTLTFSSRATYTVTTLAAAITALSKGWEATAPDSTLGTYDAMEILPCSGLNCLDSNIYLQVPYEPKGGYTIEEEVGVVYLLSNFPTGQQNVTVRYTAGYVTTPADLEQICIDLVNVYYLSRETDSTIKAEKLGDHSITYADTGGGAARDIPENLAHRLSPYLRWSRRRI